MSAVSYGHPVIDKRGAANGERRLLRQLLVTNPLSTHLPSFLCHSPSFHAAAIAAALSGGYQQMTNISNDFNTLPTERK